MAKPTPSIDKDALVELYLKQKLSQPQVARQLGCAERTVRRLLKRYGIPGHDCKGADNPNYKHGKRIGKTEYTRLRKSACEKCGRTETLGVHHKNDDHFDNRPENLETLCNPCHMSKTKKAWWDAKKAGLPTPKSNGSPGWYRKRKSKPGRKKKKPGTIDDALRDQP